jgi:hypothetical protein
MAVGAHALELHCRLRCAAPRASRPSPPESRPQACYRAPALVQRPRCRGRCRRRPASTMLRHSRASRWGGRLSEKLRQGWGDAGRLLRKVSHKPSLGAAPARRATALPLSQCKMPRVSGVLFKEQLAQAQFVPLDKARWACGVRVWRRRCQYQDRGWSAARRLRGGCRLARQGHPSALRRLGALLGRRAPPPSPGPGRSLHLPGSLISHHGRCTRPRPPPRPRLCPGATPARRPG